MAQQQQQQQQKQQTKPLQWGILGLGSIAKAFANGLKQTDTGHLVAVGSRTKDKAVAWGKEYGVAEAKCHGSYDALLADPDVQAIYIATPHPQHAEWAIKGARAKKHLLVEKPIGLNAAEAMAMTEAAIVNNVFLMEAFMYRSHPQIAKLVELLKSRAIGEVRLIQATFGFHAGFNPEGRLFKNALGGGGILDVGCYAVSMARLVAGAAQGKDYADPTDVKGTGQLGASNVDEWAAAVLKFPGGIVAQVSTSVSLNQENQVRVFGTDGWIHLPTPWGMGRDAKSNTTKIIVHKKGQPQPQEIEVTASSA
jgi:predicted dehydrogenase